MTVLKKVILIVKFVVKFIESNKHDDNLKSLRFVSKIKSQGQPGKKVSQFSDEGKVNEEHRKTIVKNIGKRVSLSLVIRATKSS